MPAMSEPRIDKLAKAMARVILTKGYAKMTAGPDGLADLIARELKIDQRVEAEIEAEAHAQLAKNKSLPPRGTGQYQAALTQMKQAIAVRKGYPL
ncbi:hypothetical protein GC173_01205 [bacterium]|nr:hypothetical protein [bacterium]